MKPLPALVALAVAATVATVPADGQPRRRDQDAAYAGLRAGEFRPLPEIERRAMRSMGGANYLGPELDARSGRYRLKFMRSGQVIWIDYDARTGQEIGRSGD